jgi:23S rRNA (cytidine1920-2'-O)/16S rRNA (cytidine1409-2'-O)-methyltransferase
MTSRQRADRLLVDRGLFESRAKAQAAIEAGFVSADDRQVRKASDAIPTDAVVRAQPAHPWVSRGGVKLAAALDHFRITVKGRICLDVGASTGGFTEVLIARGARRVYAVDVGRGQLHARLHGNPQIISLESNDIRNVAAAQVPEPVDLIVVDVSFISLKAVLAPALRLAHDSAQLVALIKPQFETERRHLKRGIVRDPTVHQSVCDDVTAFVASLGWRATGIIPSPILGGDGNAEFFIGASK